MKWGDYIKRTAVRRIVYLVIGAIFALVFGGRAFAQTGPIEQRTFPTASEAYAACMTTAQWFVNASAATRANPRCKLEITFNPPRNVNGTEIRGMYSCYHGYDYDPDREVQCALSNPYFQYGDTTCPSGQAWDAPTNSCKTDCSGKPDLNGVLAVNLALGEQLCKGGCSYAPLPEQSGAFGQETTFGATWRATGATCSADNHTKPFDPNKDICTQQGSLTQCVKPDGRFCANATTGKEICWNKGETGQRRTLDGSLAGDRQVAPGVPSVTGIDGGTTSNSTTTINNTTYNQEFKGGGTSSGPSQSNTGEGGSENPDGSDKDKGSASGGGSCSAPPSCSGDAINCAVLDQQWRTRCANDKNDDGQPDWTEGDKPTGEGEGTDGNVGESEYKRFGLSLGTDRLDTDNIFGGGTCPTFSMEVMGFSASTADIPAWCDIAAVMRAVVLIMGAYMALQILLGRI